jgi:protein-tyrosine phosphatase-like protein
MGETIPDLLPGLRQRLASEYGGIVPRETIDRVAQQALNELEGVRIREFVPVLAWRRARARLRRAF